MDGTATTMNATYEEFGGQGVEMGRIVNVQAGESVDESLYEGAGVIYAQSVTATRRGSTTRYGVCSCVCS